MMIRSLLQNSWLLFFLLLLIGLYVFQAIKQVSRKMDRQPRKYIYFIYWTILFFTGLGLFLLSHLPERGRGYLLIYILATFIACCLTAVFLLADDILRGIRWLVSRLYKPFRPKPTTEEHRIPRSTFLSWAGLLIGGSFMGSLAYGTTNKYNYRIWKQPLHFPDLPEAFRGLRIVQISDIHSGSFTDKEAVERGVKMAIAQKPDLLLFTGDLVNNRATEMKDYMDVFSRLKAPMGVYSTLGNHDYGDYVEWPTPEAKRANLEKLKQIHAQLGWRLLMNEHVIFERNGEKIALLGVENWGAKGHFPKYGRLDLAYKGTENIPFKLLMSHDPSHWDAEIRPKYPDIDLTLAGHTHGMQFGVDIPWLKWSPIKWMYKEWAGLYQQGNQYIYVNRGYGFIGYPGRVGIMPEITVIELV